jgi:hypothetical protein
MNMEHALHQADMEVQFAKPMALMDLGPSKLAILVHHVSILLMIHLRLALPVVHVSSIQNTKLV